MNSPVDILIRQAWLEGVVKTRGAYEKAILRKALHPQTETRSILIQRLESTLSEGSVRSLTVGEMLRTLRTNQQLTPGDVFSRISVTQNIYSMMEHDSISPLKIRVDVWKRLITLLGVPVKEFADVLRRTHQLVLFGPSMKGVLARYNAGERAGRKSSTLEKAFKELYAKANLAIPESEQRKMSQLIKELGE